MAETSRRSIRFENRQARIVGSACAEINLNGAGATTLEAVAGRIGLDQSSVSYYFDGKDELVAACVERTLRWTLDCALKASFAPGAERRVRSFISAQFSDFAQARLTGAAPLARMSNVRSLGCAGRASIEALRDEVVCAVRDLLDFGSDTLSASVRAHQLLSIMDWVPAWIDDYEVRDFGRVEARLVDVVEKGIGGSRRWDVDVQALPGLQDRTARDRFTTAATTVINRQGYRGASVERIAAELGVSTGSFYHHFEHKDELVAACFDRHCDLLERAHAQPEASGDDEGAGLVATVASLVACQFGSEPRLLRLEGHRELPSPMRAKMECRTSRENARLTGRIADAVAGDWFRPVDPMITARVVEALIDGAADVRHLMGGRSPEVCVAAYLDPLRTGLLAPPRPISQTASQRILASSA